VKVHQKEKNHQKEKRDHLLLRKVLDLKNKLLHVKLLIQL